ncbi:glutathione S-transferase family protein [Thorsellia anophelis]|uniref:Glutathione S-transferase n=1 Tax=Thorsellia anophelis DSM 18579 TaxID=1123402 RepID=A0A1H9Y489_9GAMM|nr:glutathione S-transferase [Thorsellia anophelis]SES63159.1 glutathione S-transferase [Thorsellia anophelis DSM 18579]
MYTLVLANKRYSSWSMRVWLLMKEFDIPFKEELIRFDSPDFASRVSDYSLTKKVPLLLDESLVISDTLAIVEYLAESHAELAIWPTDKQKRAKARSLCAQMHAGYSLLRNECPMQFDKVYKRFTPSELLRKEIASFSSIFLEALSQSDGDFLFGEYSAADAYYAPFLSRFDSYLLPLDDRINAYYAKVKMTKSYQNWQQDVANEKEDNTESSLYSSLDDVRD